MHPCYFISLRVNYSTQTSIEQREDAREFDTTCTNKASLIGLKWMPAIGCPSVVFFRCLSKKTTKMKPENHLAHEKDREDHLPTLHRPPFSDVSCLFMFDSKNWIFPLWEMPLHHLIGEKISKLKQFLLHKPWWRIIGSHPRYYHSCLVFCFVQITRCMFL